MKTTEELVRQLLDKKPAPPPPRTEDPMEKMKAGLGAVMHFLESTDGPVTAGAVSAALGVSTARVAVLLKKLDEKGYITRLADSRDARKSLICLSDAGKAFVAARREEFVGLLTAVIDTMGPERFELLLQLGSEARTAAEQYVAAHPRADE